MASIVIKCICVVLGLAWAYLIGEVIYVNYKDWRKKYPWK